MDFEFFNTSFKFIDFFLFVSGLFQTTQKKKNQKEEMTTQNYGTYTSKS